MTRKSRDVKIDIRYVGTITFLDIVIKYLRLMVRVDGLDGVGAIVATEYMLIRYLEVVDGGDWCVDPRTVRAYCDDASDFSALIVLCFGCAVRHKEPARVFG